MFACLERYFFFFLFFRPISEGWALDSAEKSDLMAVLSSTNRQIHLIEMLTDGGHFLFVFYRQETSKQTNSMSSTAIRPLRSGAPKLPYRRIISQDMFCSPKYQCAIKTRIHPSTQRFRTNQLLPEMAQNSWNSTA